MKGLSKMSWLQAKWIKLSLCKNICNKFYPKQIHMAFEIFFLYQNSLWFSHRRDRLDAFYFNIIGEDSWVCIVICSCAFGTNYLTRLCYWLLVNADMLVNARLEFTCRFSCSTTNRLWWEYSWQVASLLWMLILQCWHTSKAHVHTRYQLEALKRKHQAGCEVEIQHTAQKRATENTELLKDKKAKLVHQNNKKSSISTEKGGGNERVGVGEDVGQKYWTF